MKKKNAWISLLTPFVAIGSTTGTMLVTTSCAPSEQELFKKRKITLENILDKYLDQSVIEDYFGAYKPTWNTLYDRYYSFVEFFIYYMENFRYSDEEKFVEYDYDPIHYDHSESDKVYFKLDQISVSNLEDKEYISLKDLKENRIYPFNYKRKRFWLLY